MKEKEKVTSVTIRNVYSKGVVFIYEDDQDWAYIMGIWVDETERGKGLGKDILHKCEETAYKLWKVKLILLKVESGSWTEEWYKREGYVPYRLGGLMSDRFLWMIKLMNMNTYEDVIIRESLLK